MVGHPGVGTLEKASEHLGTIREAYDNQMTSPLSNILSGTIQTVLFTGPLIVIVGWGMDKPMGLDFDVFDIVILMLSVLAVGQFLRGAKSNYLKGILLIVIYTGIGVAVLDYPDLGRGR